MGSRKTAQRVQYLLAFVLIIVLVFSVIQMDQFWLNNQRAQPERVKEAIEKACIQCYALEGSYPPDLNYLGDHYGIQLDHERYFYYYEIFASNLMPDVEVYEKGE